ncbi:hypothetical protein C8F01DRAFT_994166, partial [Mycena amicta]
PKPLRTFPRSAFACVAFNFGPQAATIFHRDWTDRAGKPCAVWAGGPFDHTKGGHIILYELKLILEFPPWTWIIFPSAVITHGNLPVQAGDKRVSIVQYTPGNLCRFIDNGFRTEAKFKTANKKGYTQMIRDKASRWVNGLKLYSTMEELKECFLKHSSAK